MIRIRLARWAMAISLATAAFVVASQANAVSFTFNDVSSQVIDSRTTSFASLPLEQFDITNNSGVVWTDFHLTLVGYSDFGDYSFVQFGDVGGAGVYSGPGIASFLDSNGDALGLSDTLTIDGLNIASGDVLAFNVDIFGGIPEGMAGFDIIGRPSVGQNGGGPPNGGGPTDAIPEPTSALLFFAGAISIGSGMRRSARRA